MCFVSANPEYSEPKMTQQASPVYPVQLDPKPEEPPPHAQLQLQLPVHVAPTLPAPKPKPMALMSPVPLYVLEGPHTHESKFEPEGHDQTLPDIL